MPTWRLVVLALLLLVLPAAFTALFLARHAHRAVEPAAQPGGRIAGRLVPSTDVPPGGSLGSVEVRLVGIARDGAERDLDASTTAADGSFAFEAPPIDGHYAVKVLPGAWTPTAVPVSLAAGPQSDLEVAVHAAAVLELRFTHASGEPVTGGRWTVEGELARSWFSPRRGARFERRGTFRGAVLEVGGLPPGELTVHVRLDGGDSADIEVELAPGRHRQEIGLQG